MSNDTPVITDPLIPVNMDGHPLKYDDNPATLAGLKYEFKEWSERTGKYVYYVNHRAVLIKSSGKLAVDSVDAAKFYNNAALDPRGFDKPAPPTPDRIKAHNDKEPDKTKHLTATAGTFAPGDPFVVSQPLLDAENSDLLTSWTHVLGGAESTRAAIKQAKGDGLKLMSLLDDLYNDCEPSEKALVTATHNSLVAAGVVGELTLESLREYDEAYGISKRRLHPTARTAAELGELEMVNTIAQRDPNIREAYELHCIAKKPADYDSALAVLRKILRSRKTAAKLDHAQSGPTAKALSASKAPAAGGGAPTSDPLSERLDKLAAAVEKIAKKNGKRDPRRNKAGKKEEGFVIPKDKDGKILR